MGASNPRPDRPSTSQFRAYQATRDPELRAEIVSGHLGLAHHLARRFTGRGVSLDDLVQVASVALVNAVDRFDPDRGLEFSTFATPTILGELKRHLRDRGWSMRVPRRAQELHLEVGRTVERLTQQLGRTPTVPEIADATQTSEEDVLAAIELGGAHHAASLDRTTAPDGVATLADQMGEDDAALALVDDRDILARLVTVLAPREQLMIHLRFFENMTQSEIAQRLGVSQMQVSRLLARSLHQMRKAAEGR